MGSGVILTETASGDHWYAVPAEAGKSYVVSWTNGWGDVGLYTACGDVGAIWDDVLTAPSTQTYYINAVGNDGYAFTIAEVVTDNLTCDEAIDIVLDSEVTVPTRYTEYWYKVSLEAGKFYAIEGLNSGYVELFSDCGGYPLYGDGSVYEITDARTYYISAYSYMANGKFKVTEITNNRICTQADAIPLDTEVTLPTSDDYYWYEVSLDGGKVYGIEWITGDGDDYLFRTCGGSPVGSDGIYEITTANTYYIRTYSYMTNSKFKVTEITNNRICSKAETITVGNTITTLPTTDSYYWYKVTLAAGKVYEIKWEEGSNGGFELYRSCGSNRITYGNNLLYPSSAAGAHHLMATSWGGDGKFTVKEITLAPTDNRICANATAVTVGADITPTAANGTHYWYKVELTAGKTYELLQEGSGGATLYESCGGNALNFYYPYTPTASGTYSIEASAYSVDTKFKIAEITDNRACAYAVAVVGAESPEVPRYEELWYKVELTAGKAYTFEWNDNNNNNNFEVYRTCGGNPISSSSNIYEITTTDTFRIQVFSYIEDDKFKITEVTDNRVCANAEVLALDAVSPVLPTAGTEYWYKVNLLAGKPYRFDRIDGDGQGYIYAACGSNSPIAPIGGTPYTATETGAIYLLLYGYSADFKVKVSEITDNQVCALATAIDLATVITPPVASRKYYYKTTLDANKDYKMEWTGGNGEIALTNSCGGNTLAGGNGTQLYRATATGTYYIIVTAYGAASKFKVSETNIPDTDNSICANAKTLAFDTESDALLAGASYWYKLDLTAGKTYDIEITSGDADYRLYSGACGSNTPVSSPDITTSGTYYLQVLSNVANTKFKVYELTDNRACSYATPIGLDTAVTLPADETYYWYTIDFVAGRTYNVQWSGWGSVIFYDGCDGAQLGSVSSGDYIAPNTGKFYIRANTYQAGDAFTLTLTDEEVVTDNRLCAHAEQKELNDIITPTESYTDYWYKVNLQAGKGYKFEGKEGGYLEFTLYNDCGGTRLEGASFSGNNLSKLYAAEATGTYYVRVYAQAGSTLKISEVTTPTVQDVKIIASNGMSVQKGGTHKFEAYVTVLGGAAQTVTWSLAGSTVSSIATDGTLTVNAGETATTLIVTATSTVDPSKKSTVTVTPTSDPLVAVVLDLKVVSTASVAKGSTRQFEVMVIVQGGAAQTVTWSVSGGITGTSINPSSGLLTVAAAETAPTLTVTATSTVDASKTGVILVTVTPAGSTVTEIPQTTVAQSIASLQIYPNPAKEEINIRTEQPIEKVEIVDIAGRIVLSTNTNIVNVSRLPKGVYLVRVAIEGQSITKRIIKE
ncbi:hypothetical protein AGMMS49982_17020 [Bacteroidia bacterium]|nr:hypothetical protein AGMMS49982_17020 [Bacteroidia bacterium]